MKSRKSAICVWKTNVSKFFQFGKHQSPVLKFNNLKFLPCVRAHFKIEYLSVHLNMLQKIVLLSLYLTLFTDAVASRIDSLIRKHEFELSIGQSLLFVSQDRQSSLLKQSSVVVPTNAVLFLAEFRADKKMRIPAFFNLPTETKQFVVNGQPVYERASPTIGSGLQFRIFKHQIDSMSKVEFEAGPLVSLLFDKNRKIRVAPVLAGRFRILRGNTFAMYVGVSYSIGINALGVLYGTGSLF